MIESIELRNFQTHRKLKVRCSSPILSIVGRSDIGKSAILRAFRWVCLNSPSGTEFIHHGAKFCKVTLKLDGHTIVRKRSKSKNLYFLDGRKFSAFGASVPEPIAKILNVSDANFQNQLDSPFWFMESPGQVSKNINRIVNLSAMDTAISEVASRIRKNSIIENHITDNITKTQKTIDSLSWIDDARQKMTLLLDKTDEIERNRDGIESLTVLVHSAQQTASKLKTLGTAILRVHDIEESAANAVKQRKRTMALEKLVEHIKITNSIANATIPNIQPIVRLTKKAKQKKQTCERLTSILDNQHSLRRQVCALENKIAQLQKELAKVNTCPACGATKPKLLQATL